MSLENFKNSTEENRSPQESTGEEISDLEKIVGSAERGPDESSLFEGSQIFIFNKDGAPIRYALRRDNTGRLEGNSFLVQAKGFSGNGEEWSDTRNHLGNLEDGNPNKEDHRIAWTQQMSEADLTAVEKILKGKGITV